jgi:hypothetical protein
MTYDLERFVSAQDAMWQTIVAELRAARKQCHWIWFVFPQVAGLGLSTMSKRYAIASLDEARAYLAHPVLGPRLHEAAGLMLAAPAGLKAEAILGSIDATKLRSSMTLFLRAEAADPSAPSIFRQVLERFYDGEPDPETDTRLPGAA